MPAVDRCPQQFDDRALGCHPLQPRNVTRRGSVRCCTHGSTRRPTISGGPLTFGRKTAHVLAKLAVVGSRFRYGSSLGLSQTRLRLSPLLREREPERGGQPPVRQYFRRTSETRVGQAVDPPNAEVARACRKIALARRPKRITPISAYLRRVALVCSPRARRNMPDRSMHS